MGRAMSKIDGLRKAEMALMLSSGQSAFLPVSRSWRMRLACALLRPNSIAKALNSWIAVTMTLLDLNPSTIDSTGEGRG